MHAVLISQDVKTGLSIGISSGRWLGDSDQFAKDLSNEMNKEDGFSGFLFNNKSRIGFSLGILVDCQVKKAFSIQPEIYFIQKGAKFSGSGNITVDDGWDSYTFAVEEDIIIQTDYIDLLVLAKYYLSKSSVKPYLLAGPGIGYLISSKMKVKVTIEDESDSQSEKYEGFKKIDANFSFGAGLDFVETIRLDIRYQFGLIPVLKDEHSDGYNLRNGVLAFNLIAVF